MKSQIKAIEGVLKLAAERPAVAAWLPDGGWLRELLVEALATATGTPADMVRAEYPVALPPTRIERAACPHCGCADDLVARCLNRYGQLQWGVECGKCEATGPRANTRDEALAAWLRRTYL